MKSASQEMAASEPRNKKIMISQSNYIPWKGFFDSINMVDEYVIYDEMQYTRRDWRNRNRIKTAQGLQWLSIPVEVKGKYYQKINETRVSDKNWADKHWKTIQANYSRSAHFARHKDAFELLYRDARGMAFLSDINYEFIRAICAMLGIKTRFAWSSEYTLAQGRSERLVDLCKQTAATDYYSGPAAKSYMDEKLFAEEGIRVHYFDYSGYPIYRQLFGDFEHSVSIIDLIFNEGTDATRFMKSFAA